MKQEEEQKMTSEKYREGFIHFFYISPFITSIVLSLRYICLSILCAHHNTTTIDNDKVAIPIMIIIIIIMMMIIMMMIIMMMIMR